MIGDESGLVTLLDSQTLLPVARSVPVGGSVAWLSASPDNRTALVLTGGRHISDRLDVPSSGWVLVDLQAGKVMQRGQAPFKNAQVVVFAPDGRHVAIGSGTGDLIVLDTTTGLAVGPPASVHDGWTNSLAYSADSSLLVSAGADGSVSLFDGATAELLGSIVTPEQTLSAADFLADGHSVVVATNSDGLYLWDTRLEHAVETACRMAGGI